MKKHLAVLAALAIGAAPVSAAPNDTAKALEVLNKANAAVQKLSAISYEAQFFGEGHMAARVPKMNGKVFAKRGPNARQHCFRIDGLVIPPGLNKEASFKLASDGSNVYSLDYDTKVFASGPLGPDGVISQHLFPARYLDTNPFEAEIRGNAAKYLGERAVNGVTCDVVAAGASGSMGATTTLFLGKEDHLLRRSETVIQLLAGPGQRGPTGRIVFEVTGLNPRAAIAADDFRLDCPPGFQKKPLSAPQPRQAGLLPIGSDAPDWSLQSSDGKTVTLKGLRGKVVLLDFWATWCGPCKMAMPGLQKLHERFKGKPVAIYGVNCREQSPNANPMGYIKSKGYTYGQLIKGEAVASAYRVSGIPCFYIIGPDGKILDTRTGFDPRMEQHAAQVIENALKK